MLRTLTICLFYVYSVTISTVLAQPSKTTEKQQLIWWETIVNHRVSEAFSIYGEFGQRHLDGIGDLSQRIYRTGISYEHPKLPKLTIGLARFEHDILEGSSFRARPEWRSFILIETGRMFGKAQTDFRLRVEQRWNHHSEGTILTDGYDFNHRIGYRLRSRLPLNTAEVQPKTVYVEAANEVMLNYGEAVLFNLHDQTRYSIGIGYVWNKRITNQLTYLYLYQQRSSGNSFVEQQIVRVNLSVTL